LPEFFALTRNNLKIIFIGTPAFAVRSLEAIADAGFQVVAVITSPDKPAGRGLKMREPKVKLAAKKYGIPVLQPENLKNEQFLKTLKSFQADIQVVIAFRMLPEVVWNMPPLGTFNLHASLLPDYRGAAPINRAIMNGEKETGVSTFFLKHEIDTGNIIFQEKVPILPDENAGELHDKLMEAGAGLVVKTLEAVAEGNYPQLPQKPEKALKTAPKIFREDGRISWSHPLASIYNQVRGLSPYPAAWTMLGSLNMKIFTSEKIYREHTYPAGKIVSDNKSYLWIACPDGYLNLLEIQLEGKKRMAAEDFLRGFDIKEDLAG
jgi:methionyl-tRNA formyltransferase